jgi:hypothetical protein
LTIADLFWKVIFFTVSDSDSAAATTILDFFGIYTASHKGALVGPGKANAGGFLRPPRGNRDEQFTPIEDNRTHIGGACNVGGDTDVC